MKKIIATCLCILSLTIAQEKKDLRVDNYLSFDEAFAIAYLHLGPNATFEWRGNIYSTSTIDQKDLNQSIVKVTIEEKPTITPLVNKATDSKNTVPMISKTASPWGIYFGLLSLGSEKEDSKRINGISAGFSYQIDERLSSGIGFTQRGFKQRSDIWYYYEDDHEMDDENEYDRHMVSQNDDQDECYLDYCLGNNFFETYKYSGVELWTNYDLISTQNISIWSGFSYSYLFEMDMKSDFYASILKYTRDQSEHDYGLTLGLAAKNKLFSTRLSYYNSLSDLSFDTVSLQISVPLDM